MKTPTELNKQQARGHTAHAWRDVHPLIKLMHKQVQNSVACMTKTIFTSSKSKGPVIVPANYHANVVYTRRKYTFSVTRQTSWGLLTFKFIMFLLRWGVDINHRHHRKAFPNNCKVQRYTDHQEISTKGKTMFLSLITLQRNSFQRPKTRTCVQ